MRNSIVPFFEYRVRKPKIASSPPGLVCRNVFTRLTRRHRWVQRLILKVNGSPIRRCSPGSSLTRIYNSANEYPSVIPPPSVLCFQLNEIILEYSTSWTHVPLLQPAREYKVIAKEHSCANFAAHSLPHSKISSNWILKSLISLAEKTRRTYRSEISVTIYDHISNNYTRWCHCI